jgi:hypothetical protein
MTSRKFRRGHAPPVCADIDELDTEAWFGSDSRSRRSDHRLKRLCAEAERVLHLFFSGECRD